MSELAKTEAIVLTKIDFGDTSNIVSLFTKDLGRISGILKGGKTGKNGKSKVVDPPNHLEIILYNKSSRDVQLISGAEIISFYPRIHEDFDRMKFAYAVLELLKKLLPENEPNHRIFRGTIRILDLLETGEELPVITFGRYFLFILKETGYEIQLDRCTSCGTANLNSDYLSYNFDLGILCSTCGEGFLSNFRVDAELFRYLICLKNNIKIENPGERIPEMGINFMEIFLKKHVPAFTGIQTFHILK